VVRRLLLTLLLAGLTACTGSTERYRGGVLPATLRKPLPVITLTDQRAASFTLSPGKATLLFFGFTECPDVCPTTMADLAAAMRKVSAAVRSKVQVVMVSSDPVRDTPAKLAQWLGGYDPTFIGLTGEWSVIRGAAQQVGVLLPDEQPKTLEDVGHSSQVIGFTPDGQGRVQWLASADGKPVLAQQLAHDLPLLVAGKAA
jgi:protein SCO1/2